ncbi:30S ribosomal protein S1 [Hordeum vulgare]|nr:30S ribosomal protein S1 [Hordeum vulgare]
MEAFAAAPAAGVFAAARPSVALRRRGRGASSSSSSSRVAGAGRVRLVRARGGDGGGDLPALDKWDMMELEFGRFLGEDPKLTLAKILLKKSDPDASSLDVEKLVASKKDTLDVILKEFMEANKQDKTATAGEAISAPMKDKQPLGVSRPALSKPKLDEASLAMMRPAGSKPKQVEPPLTFVRPAAIKPKVNKPSLTLMRPMGSKPKVQAKLVQDSWPSKESLAAGTETSEVGSTTTEDIVDVTLRKPVVHQSEDDEQEPELKMKPNLDLKMRKDMDEDLSNISLLQKPEAAKEMANALGSTLVAAGEDTNEREEGLQPSEESLTQQIDSPALDNPSVTDNNFSMQAFLQGRPRKDLPVETSPSQVDAEKSDSDDKKGYVDDGGNVLSSTLEDITESDWTRLEHYASTGERVEVELINCSAKGFVVSLDSMIGFLPYRNLATKWKFLAFETWLRRKGGDPSLYKQSMSMEEGSDVNDRSIEPESVSEVAHQDQGTLQSRLKFEELLRTYDEEKSKFLSSFIGQRLRVSVVLADRNSKRLFFSMRPKESDELIQKRKSLMARLSVGDIVTCTIKRFVYFGIFVEVEGVPALIQQWEVSWDETLDPSVSYRIGQVVDAKVIQLDFNNSRIFLSLKDVKPSPPVGALEAVIGDEASLDGSLEPAQADFEWPEVDSLIEELKNIEQVKDVYKGRFFRSPGLAPTFQVYMASLVGQKYKVLARYGNSVQEVMVETSLDKEGLKEAIMMCTNRVS